MPLHALFPSPMYAKLMFLAANRCCEISTRRWDVLLTSRTWHKGLGAHHVKHEFNRCQLLRLSTSNNFVRTAPPPFFQRLITQRLLCARCLILVWLQDFAAAGSSSAGSLPLLMAAHPGELNAGSIGPSGTSMQPHLERQ